MRRFLCLAAALLISLPALAVRPQSWSIDSTDDYLAGDLQGFGVTSRGALVSAPVLVKLAEVDDPFVFASASDPAGTRFFATGNGGKVYRLRNGKLDLLFTAGEPEVYALAWSDGALYAGSSPHGKIYRIDPATGKATVWFDPDEAYIWAIAPAGGGALFVTTGLPGRLYRVGGNGASELWFDAPEPHLRSIAVKPDGTVLVGGAGKGGIYEVTGKGVARALYQSDLSEITAITFDSATGVAWAAAATSALPTTAPQPGQPPAATGAGTTTGAASTSGQDQVQASVDVSFSFDEPQPATTPGGSSELDRIERDGYVERVSKFDREVVYAIGIEEGDPMLSTGPKGRLYRFHDGELRLVATVPQSQIVSYTHNANGSVVTTTNGGAVYALNPSSRRGGLEFRSAVKDTGRFSTFGEYRVEGDALAQSGVDLSFRSGNTATPDSTWSEWTSPTPQLSGSVTAPPARYLQLRLRARAMPTASVIDGIHVAYVNRNSAPMIESLNVSDPGVVYITSAFPSAPGVVEATNPDENGIFTSIDNPATRNDPGKRYFRKGYQTFTWRARDANGDSLRFDLYFRRVGESRWLRLRSNVRESQYNFDSSQLPDGRYELRLVASDEPDNPARPEEAEKEGVFFDVDNTPPAMTVTRSGDDFVIDVTDAASPLAKAEYSIDAEKWIALDPIDGILDGKHEVFRLKQRESRGHFVMVRVLDSSFNVASVRVE